MVGVSERIEVKPVLLLLEGGSLLEKGPGQNEFYRNQVSNKVVILKLV